MTTKKTNIEKYSLWKASRADKLIITAPILFLTCTTLIPSYYTWNTPLPSRNQIYHTTGILSYGGNNQSGHYPIITKKNGEKISFSCRFSSDSRHICLMDEQVLKNSHGKNAEVGWFWQKMSPISIKKRVIYLNIEGKSIIKKETTESAINKMKKKWKFDTLRFLVFSTILYSACRFILKKHHEYQVRISKEQQKGNDNE
jgi:hypothetical protein